jgi:hypothetical protein
MQTGPCWKESCVCLSGSVLGQAPLALEQEVPKDCHPWGKLLMLGLKKDSFFFLLVVLELGAFAVCRVLAVYDFYWRCV